LSDFSGERPVAPPEITVIALTRVSLGAGAALLLADCMSRQTRRGAGWALLGVGVISTFPLLLNLLRKPRI
jgi:hypothetical protein